METSSLGSLRLSIASGKIAHYLLDITHPKGGPKARYFLSLGFQADDPERFVEVLFQHASDANFIRTETSVWGVKYLFEGPISAPDGRDPKIRSIWQVKFSNEGDLDLVTAYPLS